MKQEPDFYLYFTLDNGESYDLGITVHLVDQDIETRQVWADYEIVSVNGATIHRFRHSLSDKELSRLELELLAAIWEDSEADRVAVMSANLEY